jgi:hypothetical protein
MAIFTNRLTDGENMPFIKGALESGPAMTGGAKGDALFPHGWIWSFGIVRGNQAWNVR